MNKFEVVPELRFPGFIGSWEIKHIGKVAKNLDSKRKPITQQDRISGSTPYYGASGIIDYVHGYIYDEPLLCISEDGANLVARSYPIAFSIKGKTWVNNHAHVLKFQYSHTQTIVENYLNSISLEGYLTGMAQPKLNRAKLDIIPIPLPLDLKEQQKIADILSSIDDLISANTKKVESLKSHKKGLIQKFFPAEGKSSPELRFSEFKEHWEIKTLNALVHYENGKAHENDIVESGRYIVVNSKFISSDGQVKKYTNNASLIASKDDILMVLSDVPNGRAIAKCLYVKEDNIYTVNQRICKLRSKGVNGQFLFYQLNRNAYFLGFDDGVKQTNLKKDDVLRCPLFIPNSAKEQKKIADCLSSLDELIDLQSKKNEALNEYKKGLIQGLFPNFKGCEK